MRMLCVWVANECAFPILCFVHCTESVRPTDRLCVYLSDRVCQVSNTGNKLWYNSALPTVYCVFLWQRNDRAPLLLVCWWRRSIPRLPAFVSIYSVATEPCRELLLCMHPPSSASGNTVSNKFLSQTDFRAVYCQLSWFHYCKWIVLDTLLQRFLCSGL
jgi:hypothetical protein